MTFGELRTLPVGRGQIGRIKYVSVGRGKIVQGVGHGQTSANANIPSSVLKNGVKLPQIQPSQIKQETVEKPFLTQMKQELDQIAPTISENPFMKNDRKKKGDLPQQSETNSLTPSSIESRSVDDSLPYDDDLQALKKDDLKRELCTVLEGIRKTEDINDEDEDEIEVDQNDISEDTEDSLLSDRCCSTSSDETIECEDDCSLNAQDPQDDNVSVTENEDIITSAL